MKLYSPGLRRYRAPAAAAVVRVLGIGTRALVITLQNKGLQMNIDRPIRRSSDPSRVSRCVRGLFVLGLLLRALTLPPHARAADPASVAGHWEGGIELPGATLGVLVDLTLGADGAWTGTIDIPMQGAKGLKLDEISVLPDTIRFRIAGVPGDPRFVAPASAERIEGTFTQGGQSLPFRLGREALEAPKRPQDPQPPFGYRIEEVTYPSGEITLAGTITLPEGPGPFPAAVLVSGSGPQNRDEELFGHKPFLVLADHLTRAGIAVLRFDDRGVGGSGGSTMNSTTGDVASDALAGITCLQNRPEIDPKRVGLIGHSEGGIVGPLAASRSDQVAYVVMMAGTGVTGAEVVRKQSVEISRASGLPEPVIALQDTLLGRLFQLVRADADSAEVRAELDRIAAPHLAAASDSIRVPMQTVLDECVRGAGQMAAPWFHYFMDYDPRPALRNVRVPVLVLNGEKDLQVLPDQNLPEIEKALAAAGNDDVTVRRFPGLNHIFQPATTGSPMEYPSIETTIDPAALEAISGWILERFGGK